MYRWEGTDTTVLLVDDRKRRCFVIYKTISIVLTQSGLSWILLSILYRNKISLHHLDPDANGSYISFSLFFSYNTSNFLGYVLTLRSFYKRWQDVYSPKKRVRLFPLDWSLILQTYLFNKISSFYGGIVQSFTIYYSVWRWFSDWGWWIVDTCEPVSEWVRKFPVKVVIIYPSYRDWVSDKVLTSKLTHDHGTIRCFNVTTHPGVTIGTFLLNDRFTNQSFLSITKNRVFLWLSFDVRRWSYYLLLRWF